MHGLAKDLGLGLEMSGDPVLEPLDWVLVLNAKVLVLALILKSQVVVLVLTLKLWKPNCLNKHDMITSLQSYKSHYIILLFAF